MVMPGTTGGTMCESSGTSAAVPQKPPTQMGKSGSPCSNSTHTPLPISGKVNTPMLMPATGTQGMAQLDNITFDTSGTIAWMRPICMGSTLFTTVPRYL